MLSPSARPRVLALVPPSLALAVLCALGATPPVRAQLGDADAQFWFPGTPGLTTPVQAGSHFGQELVAGDFDGDGFDDLAVGQPFAAVGGDSTAGVVLVLYGGPVGPGVAGHQVWTQDAFGADPAEPDDFFGWTLAAGDFDDDGFDDLAVGVPLEDAGSFEAAGIVQVLYGTAAGLSAAGAQTWGQDEEDVPDLAEPEDGFGGALAAGDFDDDGFDDLAIGVSGEDVEGSPTYSGIGAVHVLFGNVSGLRVSGSLFLQPDDDAVDLPPASSLEFGAALAACRLGTGPTFLAVGAPGLLVATQAAAGGVIVLGGLDLEPSTAAVFTQDSAGVPGAPEPGDRFGSTLACGDFDRDGADEIAVASPQESIDADAAAGAVHVLETGVSPIHTLFYEELLSGSTSDPNERFGAALAVGDFDADGAADLAIGAPGEIVDGFAFVGAAFVLRGEPGVGLVATGHQVLVQTVDEFEAGDRNGAALAAGRFAGRAATDLALGAPFETVAAAGEIGAVEILFAAGLFRDGFESGDTSAWSSTLP